MVDRTSFVRTKDHNNSPLLPPVPDFHNGKEPHLEPQDFYVKPAALERELQDPLNEIARYIRKLNFGEIRQLMKEIDKISDRVNESAKVGCEVDISEEILWEWAVWRGNGCKEEVDEKAGKIEGVDSTTDK